jgi:Gpi18-like mannosyltransferase
MRQFRYITGIVSISADAVVLKPIAILKTLEYLDDFSNFKSHCVFATSMYKWITNELWTYSALVFLA